MKLTDFALIFVAVFIPIIVLVYVNTSFVIKAEKQEMYYKNIMNSAVIDAVSTMKNVENEDEDIDYGYSGTEDKKVSINADLAISTFYNSLANNFNIKDNELSLQRLKMYIPVIAILDYDGIYIHSAEETENGELKFVTKPKVYYTYTYVLTKKSPSGLASEAKYNVVNIEDVADIQAVKADLVTKCIYSVNFTMDDYIYLNVYEITDENKLGNRLVDKKFYLKDEDNNEDLIYTPNQYMGILTEDQKELKQKVIDTLSGVKKDLIARLGMEEISYAVNKHNEFAKAAGINYVFRLSVESDSSWYETMDGIGMIAIIQGVSLGNRYLNYKAYSASDLIMTKRYYVSSGMQIEGRDLAYLSLDLYHISDKCVIYKEYINITGNKMVPQYYTKKADAATQGFYPCPICKP